MDLNNELSRLIDRCREDYQANRKDPYDSHIYASKLETLEWLAGRLTELGPEALLAQLLEERPGVEADLDREDKYPSFDWYNEHYQYLRLKGDLDARQAVEKLLTEQTPC